ncbi:hypothetical protein [Campylobacter concisus]|uniref:hypothetical protein n=1 Tax=Campylobacter concisus TaxID=199 RepID=UPI0011E6EAAA|nr:hypothetical protein [Campylobacter concisus]
MQSKLVNKKITKDKIISIDKYSQIENLYEFILYSDNILEGISVLNDLSLKDDFLHFKYVVYETIDQPIYIFSDSENNNYAIKICGNYNKWELPKDVSEIVKYIDLPDYIFYSIKNQKVILAGENTETASVGNSQWQREGRKIAAARLGVPFIYQTFYSGRDESQNTIREPTSLQAYNHIVYSIRYKTPSFVTYFENNFKNSQIRSRQDIDAKDLFIKYIKILIKNDINSENINTRKNIEKKIFLHMINYLKETKISSKKNKQRMRLKDDLPCLDEELYKTIENNSDIFAQGIVDFIYEKDIDKKCSYIQKSKILDFKKEQFQIWKPKIQKKDYLEIFLNFLNKKNKTPISYIGGGKIGFANKELCKDFLLDKFKPYKNDILKVFDKFHNESAIIFPLRIHKLSNKKLTFSSDPESGEIVAFSELFAKNLKNEKTRLIIGYCTVDTPSNFNLDDKYCEKLHKAIFRYIDILILDNSKIYFPEPYTMQLSNFKPKNILKTKRVDYSEEVCVVSTYLNQSTINSNWDLCFIHTHHSSWQQLVVFKDNKPIQQKIDRISTKLDLIMQQDNKFMLAEGKEQFGAFLKDKKIQIAFKKATETIEKLYKQEITKFDVLIYNLITNPEKKPEFYVCCEVDKINGAMSMGHFNDIVYNEDYVIIIVYLRDNSKTGFKLVYSPKFNSILKKQLDIEFCQ